MRNLLLGASIAATVLSCSLFTSLGGLSSDADEPLPDGGGAGDGTTSNGGDGGAGDAGDAAVEGGPFCATLDATLCDDFDDPKDIGFAQWKVEVETKGEVSRVDAGYSLPNAFACTAVSGSSEQVTARLQKTFEGVKRARYAYRFRIDEHDATVIVPLFQLNLDTAAGAKSSVRLSIKGSTAKFEGAIYPPGGGGTFPDLSVSFGVTPAEWHSVDLSIDWEPSPAMVTVDFDGTRLADNLPVPGSTFGPGTLLVTAGIYYLEGGDGPWRVFGDDVALWVE